MKTGLQQHQGSSEHDIKCLEGLMECYAESLCKFSVSFVKVPEIAEEIVSDVFLKMWEQEDRLHKISNIKAYLFTSTKNLSLNYLKVKKHQPIFSVKGSFRESLAVGAPSPEQVFLANELHDKIGQAVNDLPENCRQIYSLVKEEGFKYREVAKLLDISINTVENQMGKVLKRIRQAIEPYLSEKREQTSKKEYIKLLPLALLLIFFQLFLR